MCEKIVRIKTGFTTLVVTIATDKNAEYVISVNKEMVNNNLGNHQSFLISNEFIQNHS